MWDGGDGDDRNPVVQGVLLMARVNDPQVGQRQVLKGNVHGATCAGSIGIFELKSVVLATDPHQEIQFRAGMGCPKVSIAAFKCPDDLL